MLGRALQPPQRGDGVFAVGEMKRHHHPRAYVPRRSSDLLHKLLLLATDLVWVEGEIARVGAELRAAGPAASVGHVERES